MSNTPPKQDSVLYWADDNTPVSSDLLTDSLNAINEFAEGIGSLCDTLLAARQELHEDEIYGLLRLARAGATSIVSGVSDIFPSVPLEGNPGERNGVHHD